MIREAPPSCFPKRKESPWKRIGPDQTAKEPEGSLEPPGHSATGATRASHSLFLGCSMQ